jgi:SAM-dependent methyltransferase
MIDRSSRAGEWDQYGAQWITQRPHRLWRKHSDAVNIDLIRQWLPAGRMKRVLKTDLFDEAVSDGVCNAIAERTGEIIGLDVSSAVLGEAGKSCAALLPAGADVRSLPFRSHAFDAIVSLSTLDHFDSREDVVAALRELHRVLVPGGTMILTLDNLANPVIAIRNALPYRVTHATGLVPYPIGRTFGPRETRQMVVEASFEVVEETAVMHAPRVLAVPLMNVVRNNGNGTAAAAISRAAMWFERLRPLPSRFITGHFVAIRAVKPV